jgi:hypothetical protein
MLVKIIRALLFVPFIAIALVSGAMAHVSLDYPVGGESFDAGEIVEIRWHIIIQHAQENWDLHFSPDGGQTWENLRLDLPTSQLTFQWTVPEVETDQARIRVTQDNIGSDYQDVSGDFTIQQASTSAPAVDEGRPRTFALQANYPNPFNASTTIGYLLDKKMDVRLIIYNIRGQMITTLVEEHQAAGSYHVRWDGQDVTGRPVASGIYLYSLQAGAMAEVRKMALLR